MSSLATVAIVVSTLLGQADTPQSNAEHLAEYGKLFEGKWVGEWEMDFTIPGVVEEGDKVTIRSTTKWILSKNALETTWEADINGKTTGGGKGTAGWDRATKEIVSYGFGTFGGHSNSVFVKRGDSWVEIGTGVSAEGKKYPIVNIITFSDDGNTQKLETSGRVDPEGKPMPNFTITYKKQK